MLPYFYKLVKGFVTMILNSEFHKETDVETILIHYITGEYCWPPRADLDLAYLIASKGRKLGIIREGTGTNEIEVAMCWVVGVGVKEKRVARA